MEEAHHDEQDRRRAAEPAAKAADRALLLLDEFLGLLQALVGDERLIRRLRAPGGGGHVECSLGIASRVGSAPDAGPAGQTVGSYSTFTPCSARYFFAPGWNGNGDPIA